MPHTGEYLVRGTTPAIAPSLLNSWSNLGGGYAPASYYRDDEGIVNLSGVITNGTITLSAFSIPAGFRPLTRLIFSTIADQAAARLDVTSAGDVIPMAGGTGYFSLCGISFRAEQ